ncbi:hypothetical protein [Pantoea dispersa]|uniref:hypothetical protein n=1 Tax=Pantoea dispersa TaxID=59814 RepID=UPI002859F24D|nr:hypothetical protein [Pantoea dispersa]MDR6295167.1 hypothetical protein [Pantoea dispersa]
MNAELTTLHCGLQREMRRLFSAHSGCADALFLNYLNFKVSEPVVLSLQRNLMVFIFVAISFETGLKEVKACLNVRIQPNSIALIIFRHQVEEKILIASPPFKPLRRNRPGST